jgi:hypothetical protein
MREPADLTAEQVGRIACCIVVRAAERPTLRPVGPGNCLVITQDDQMLLPLGGVRHPTSTRPAVKAPPGGS